MKMRTLLPALLLGLTAAIAMPASAEGGHRHSRSCGHSYQNSYRPSYRSSNYRAPYRESYRPYYRPTTSYFYSSRRPSYGVSYYYSAPPVYYQPAPVYYPAPRPYYRPVYHRYPPVRPGVHLSIGLGW